MSEVRRVGVVERGRELIRWRAELPAAKTTEPYLGLLYAMEDYAV